MAKKLIVVAGNIGAGKTSLTERIGERMGFRTAFESVADNPYLSDFYADMRAWSFHLQIFFLGHRADQHLDLANDPRSAIIDRSIYEDAHIFARALLQMGNMSERDYASYQHLFNLVVKTLPPPDLLIFLHAPVPVLMDRIRKRARDIETGISEEYLQLLESYYRDWISSFDLCPVLTIHTHDEDFVHQPQRMGVIVDKINAKLSGKEEVQF